MVKAKKGARPKLRAFKVGKQMTDLEEWRDELDEYTDILLGRKMPPIDSGVMTLLEVANAYYARAQEIHMRILRGEASGLVPKGTPLYRFRTGELRAFREMAQSASELGSRRVTAARMEYEQT